MSLVCIATPGSPQANSLVSAEAFDAFVVARMGAAVPADTQGRIRALLTATRRLEQLRYRGAPASFDQALSWPRAGVRDPRYDEAAEEGETVRYLDRATVPDAVQRACCVVAVWLLQAQSASPAAEVLPQTAALARDSVLTLGDGTSLTLRNDEHALPPEMWRELSGLVRWPEAGGVARRA